LRSSTKASSRVSVARSRKFEDLGHDLVVVAAMGARQVRHELRAQGLLDIVKDVLLHHLHAQHPHQRLDRGLLGQARQHPGGVLGADLGQDDRDGLRVLVLEVRGEHVLIDVAELVPDRTSGRTADVLHDRGHLARLEELAEQALGGLIAADQAAGAAEAQGEVAEQGLDHLAGDNAEARHGLGDLLDLLHLQLREQLARVLLAAGEEEHRGLLGTAERGQDASLGHAV
jgi:hypothetical protein